MTDEKTPQPVARTGDAQGLILAVLAVLTAFHVVTLTPEQTAAVLGLLAAGAVVASRLVRRRTTPWLAGTPRKGVTWDQHLDELAELAWSGVEGVEFVDDDGADFHDAFDAPHGANEPGEQGGA